MLSFYVIICASVLIKSILAVLMCVVVTRTTKHFMLILIVPNLRVVSHSYRLRTKECNL